MNCISMNEDRREFWIEFIELYRSLPVLWNTKCDQYSNRELRSRAYQKLVDKLREIDEDADRALAVRKINTFRTNYRRVLRKGAKSLSEGSDDSVLRTSLWYFNYLTFLHDGGLNIDTKPIIEDIREMQDDDILDSPIVTFRKYNSLPSPRKRRSTAKNEDNKPKRIGHDSYNDNSPDILSKGWASQYAELSTLQKIFARKIISDVLFHGCLGHLTKCTVQSIQEILEPQQCGLNPFESDSDRE